VPVCSGVILLNRGSAEFNSDSLVAGVELRLQGVKKSFTHRGGVKPFIFRSANTLYRGGHIIIIFIMTWREAW
jgi:hypothetical protein